MYNGGVGCAFIDSRYTNISGLIHPSQGQWIITGVSTSTTFDLPEQAAEAGEALIGFCNGLPIQSY